MPNLRPGRRQRLREISERIGRRKMVFFGTRGTDARPLLELEQFGHCVSLVAPLYAVSMPDECCLEILRGLRMDLDTYHTDRDYSEEARLLHRSLLRACDEPSILVTYRPAGFLTSVCFPRMETTQYLGVFDGLCAMLEHKPFVETALRDAGVPVIGWNYFADEDIPRLAEDIAREPHVLRVNRSSGGKGLVLAQSPEELQAVLPSHSDRFIGAAPFLHPNTPLNIGACIFRDGSVTLHTPSLQLIGLGCCTDRQFGYCCNDWARIRDLEPQVLDALEEMTLMSGHWLHKMGYLGAFGVDAVVHQGRVSLSEINVRFQGSSAISAELDSQMDMPDIYCDHMAAFLDLMATPPMRVRDLVQEQASASQVICYNTHDHELTLAHNDLGARAPHQLDLLPAPGIRLDEDAILFKAVVEGPVTTDGLSLSQDICDELEALKLHLFTNAVKRGYETENSRLG